MNTSNLPYNPNEDTYLLALHQLHNKESSLNEYLNSLDDILLDETLVREKCWLLGENS
jgi:hypothetical protein